MSIFAYDIITTLDATCTATGTITAGYAISDADRNRLSAASLGGRIMPRILCTAVAGSGSVTLSSLDYSLDGGTRWATGQTFTVAVSGKDALAHRPALQRAPCVQLACAELVDVKRVRSEVHRPHGYAGVMQTGDVAAPAPCVSTEMKDS